MKMTAKKLLTLFLIFAVVLVGCGRRDSETATQPHRIVTGVSVSFRNGPMEMHRQYTTSAKMRAILNYLRWIDPYGTPAEDPENVAGSEYHIVLHFSDDSQKVYRQKADRFMQVSGAPWKNINPENAMTLGKILGQMESD